MEKIERLKKLLGEAKDILTILVNNNQNKLDMYPDKMYGTVEYNKDELNQTCLEEALYCLDDSLDNIDLLDEDRL